MLEAIRQGLREALADDDRVFLIGIDIGVAGGIFRATEGLLDEFGERRVVDAPLGECGYVGAAIGAALDGLRPVVEIQFGDFLLPAMNQIVNEAAKIRYRSAGDFTCPLVIRMPSGAGIRGSLYHSQSFESLFAHVPGLKVVAPSTPSDARGLLKAAIRDPDPVLFFEHKKLYRLFREEVPDDQDPIPLGRARVEREGADLSIVTYGLMRHFASLAAETLGGEGIDAEVLDLRSLRPMDTAAVARSVGKTGRALVVYEPNRFAGIGAEVAAFIADDCFASLDAPVRRLATPEVPMMPFAANLEDALMISPEQIVEAARSVAGY